MTLLSGPGLKLVSSVPSALSRAALLREVVVASLAVNNEKEPPTRILPSGWIASE